MFSEPTQRMQATDSDPSHITNSDTIDRQMKRNFTNSKLDLDGSFTQKVIQLALLDRLSFHLTLMG